MSGIISALLPTTDAILGVRDSVGAVKQPVYFVTRTWYQDSGFTTPANEAGGYAKDSTVHMLPSPRIVELKQDLRTMAGGQVRNGDIILKSISQNKYNVAQIDGTSSAINVENLYLVGDKMYQVVKVTQNYLTWDIVLRELTNQTRY